MFQRTEILKKNDRQNRLILVIIIEVKHVR